MQTTTQAAPSPRIKPIHFHRYEPALHAGEWCVFDTWTQSIHINRPFPSRSECGHYCNIKNNEV